MNSFHTSVLSAFLLFEMWTWWWALQDTIWTMSNLENEIYKAQKCKGWGLWNHQKSCGLTTSSILLNTILLWVIYCQTNSNTCILGKVIQLVFFYSLSWEIVLPHRNLWAELKWKVFDPSPGLFLPHRIDSVEAEGSPFLVVLEKPETTEIFFLFFRYQGFCIITTLRKVSQMLY